MGYACSKTKMSSKLIPDPATGLSKDDIKHIQGLWGSIVDKNTFKQIGTLFFIQLFKKYPYMQEYFHDFNKDTLEELKENVALRAHAISVFIAITSYVDCVKDPVTLVALIHKRTNFHYKRGVSFEDMENLKEVLLEFLAQHSSGYKYGEKGVEAWNKLLTLHNNVYKAKLEELSQAQA